MKEQSCTTTTLAPVSGHSRTIAKTTTTTTQQKPMIRIVHLIAPEIIKTDVNNFRELVQRLTGKQRVSSCTHAAKARINKIRRHNTILSMPAATRSSTSTTTTRSMPAVGHAECKGVHAHGKKLILQQQNEGEKDGKTNELELWMRGDDELATTTSSSSSGGFFGGLGDVEGLLFNVPPLMLNPSCISSSPTLMDPAAAWKIEEGVDR